MPQLLETSSTNWDLGPIYDDYPDDAADVVQALGAYGVQSDDAAGVVQAPEAYGVQPDDAAGVEQAPEAYWVHPEGVVQAPEAYWVQPADLHQVRDIRLLTSFCLFVFSFFYFLKNNKRWCDLLGLSFFGSGQVVLSTGRIHAQI